MYIKQAELFLGQVKAEKDGGDSVSNASCLFSWKLQQTQRAEQCYLLEQILIYKAIFFNAVTAISCTFSPARNKSLHAVFSNICASGGDALIVTAVVRVDVLRNGHSLFKLTCETVQNRRGKTQTISLEKESSKEMADEPQKGILQAMISC